jgi:glycerate 2-kinase
MKRKIKNYEEIVNHGDQASRRIVLDLTEATRQHLDAYQRIKSIARLDRDILRIGERSWDLSRKRCVYLVGAGKACNAMAMAFDEILGERLTKGIAIVKVPDPDDVFHRTEVFVGGHPLPNEEGLRASRRILDLVDHAGPDDLFIGVISGGSSALMNCPIEGITLQEEIDTTDILLKSGAGIFEINAIRRHISQMNGGMLARRIQSVGAEFIGVGISDGIGVPPTGDIAVPYRNYASTPIGPDRTTLADARKVIRDYDLAQRLPRSVVDYLMKAGPEQETPKEFPGNTYFLINAVPDSCLFAKKAAESMGLPALILTTFLEGESRDAGTVLAAIAREVQATGSPVQPPCVILSCGETSTQILDNSLITGHGGPSQELTASFAIAAAKIPGACMLSIDSEGTDGTTPAAGGITDSKTYAAAALRGIDFHAALRGHATHEALGQLEDVVLTGNTGTNLCDFNVLYVPARER